MSGFHVVKLLVQREGEAGGQGGTRVKIYTSCPRIAASPTHTAAALGGDLLGLGLSTCRISFGRGFVNTGVNATATGALRNVANQLGGVARPPLPTSQPTLAEAVLEPPGQRLHVLHAAGAGRLAANGLLTPLVCKSQKRRRNRGQSATYGAVPQRCDITASLLLKSEVCLHSYCSRCSWPSSHERRPNPREA